ncbi:hypothetical protein B0H66DRAFT_503168 [Apodospora peruviana]|uniref:Pre-mRNA-processing factor 19 n=1 Tax=Apodospora peruviana TaxID=516989 RepID=A0AAE0M0F2_9PEZI|nr:hypothetical protein B0H66DRAFT_503168 [Apodospora peruviana]
MAPSSESVKLDFITLDVFTDTRFLGNPLAVVFIPASQRSRVSQETKQRIAREFNLSETVFLHTLDREPDTSTATREMIIFTIDEELPFAGHPTIGSAYLVLHHLGWGHVDTLLTKAGPIRIAGSGSSVRATIPHAVHIHQQTLGDVVRIGGSAAGAIVKKALSDDPAISAAELAAPVVSIVKGMTFVLVRLPSLEHLAKVTTAKGLDFSQVDGLLLDKGEWEKSFISRYYYVLTEAEASGDEPQQKWVIRTRMVETGSEDPATGSAACTLASYLTIRSGKPPVESARFKIIQGVEMGRQSEIVVDVTARVEEETGEVGVKEIFLGGTAVVVMNGTTATVEKVGALKSRRNAIWTTITTIPTTITTILDQHSIDATHSPICFAHVLSGEVPEEPVVSRKTGTVFEKRLILKYIEENGKEPGTDDELDPEDLLPLKSSRLVRPRPPTFTSLPSLLKAFQDEWDAIVLESYNTREQLARTREELATALYQHDAAVRVIARLTKERDEAREALSKVTVTPTAAGNGGSDAMAVDNLTLSQELQDHVDELQQQLTKGRKKRPVPSEWATSDYVAALESTASTELSISQTSTLTIQSEHAVIGSLDGKVDVYSLEANKVERSLDIGEPVTATAWVENKVFTATSKGTVKAYVSGEEKTSFHAHAGPVTGLSVHPGGRIVASTGVDKSFVFYDIETLAVVSHVYTDTALTACAFHPDGHLFAAGTQSGDIKVFETKTGTLAATFSLGPAVELLVFSENGFWFAAAGKGQPAVTIFDLRKSGQAAQVKELQTGDVQSLSWDFTGQYLATAGSSGITVQQYLKSSKAWSEPLRTAAPAVAIQWGPKAKSLVAVTKEGTVSVLKATE